MLDPFTILLALPVFLLVVLMLVGATLTWGVIRARMWQRAYPWWDLKPRARLRFVLLHVLYFFIGATIYTVWGLFINFSSAGRPVDFTVAGFAFAWLGAVFIGALLMVPPRAIAYVWHVVERRDRPRPIEPSAMPLAPNTSLPGVPPTASSEGSSPQ
jgi:hypothetical protein